VSGKLSMVYVTGNENKAKRFNDSLGLDIEHHSADVDELQSLDVREVVEHKVKGAYDQLKQPVIVEDTFFVVNAMGRLPGPLIKWFLEEVGPEGIMKMTEGFTDKSAFAGSIFAYYDGERLEIIESRIKGVLADRTYEYENGWGFDSLFIPDGFSTVASTLSDDKYKEYYARVKPFAELRKFLDSL